MHLRIVAYTRWLHATVLELLASQFLSLGARALAELLAGVCGLLQQSAA